MAPADDGHRTLKATLTLIALGIILVRLLFPDLKFDAVSLGLLALAVLPWLSPLIKSAELPGGFKIEFQDVKAAAERVTAGQPAAPIAPDAKELSFLAVADQDPNLALVGLRIEIEKRIRALAERAQIPSNRPLTQLTRELERREVLYGETLAGLRDLIALGNQAAHGRQVSPEAAASAVDYGPRVLRVLDAKIDDVGAT